MKKTTLLSIMLLGMLSAQAQVKNAVTPYSSDVVTTQPAGTLHANQYTNYYHYRSFMGYEDSGYENGQLGSYVVGDDGSVYIQNPVSQISNGAWIKGEKAGGDTIVFHTPQAIYSNTGITGEMTLYATRLVLKNSTFAVDQNDTDMKFILRGDSLYQVGKSNASDVFGVTDASGSWQSIYGVTWGFEYSEQKDKKITVPAEAKMNGEDYTFEWQGDSTLEAVKTKVTFDGNDIYVLNPGNSSDDEWLKGTKNAAGQYVFPSLQYIGVNRSTNNYEYILGGTPKKVTDDSGKAHNSLTATANIAFSVNNDTLSTNQVLAINKGKDYINTQNVFTSPRLYKYSESKSAPAAPSFIDFDAYDTGYGFGDIIFSLPALDVKGSPIDKDKLYYNIYYDDKVLTMSGSNGYTCFSEPTTDIPYDFSDERTFNITANGARHVFMFLTNNFDSIGVQQLYKNDTTVLKSKIMYYNKNTKSTSVVDGIKGIVSSNGNSDTVIRTEYFDMSGRMVTPTSKGLYIRRDILRDGKSESKKVILR